MKPMMTDSVNLFRDWQQGGADIFMPEDQRQHYKQTPTYNYGGKKPWMRDEDFNNMRNAYLNE